MRWDAILRITIISVLGLFPALLISAVAVGSIFGVPDFLMRGRFVLGLFLLTFSCMSVFGTIALIQHLFGKSLHEVRAGMLAGLATMVVMVVQVPVRVYLDSLGVQGMLPRDNLLLAVGAINGVISIIPLVVYSHLAYYSWKAESRVESQHAAN